MDTKKDLFQKSMLTPQMKHLRDTAFRKYVVVYLLEFLVFSVTGIIDTVVVGRFWGENGLAAMKLSMPVFAVLSMLGNVFGTGLSVCLSKLIAHGKKERANQTFLWVLSTITGIALIFLVISLVFKDPLISFFAGNISDPALKQMVGEYLLPILGFSLPVIAYYVLSAVIALEGDEKRIRISVIAVLITDIIGDLLAVRHGLGVFGIALASILAYVSACLILCVHFLKEETLFYPDKLRYEKEAMREVVIAGNTDAISGTCIFLAPMIINRIMTFYGGTMGLAALSVQDAVHYLPEALCKSISSAVLLFTCIYAAEQDHEALSNERIAVRKTITDIVTLSALLMFIFAPFIISPFTDDPVIKEQAVRAFRWYLAGVPFLSANLASISYMKGMGKTGIATCSVVIYELMMPVSSAFLLGHLAGTEGIYASFAVKEMLLFLAQMLHHSIYRKKNPGRVLGENEWEEILDELRWDLESTEDVTSASASIIKICEEHNVRKKQAVHMALCFEEIGVNSILHGFRNNGNDHLEARFILTDDHMILRLSDNCKAYNLTDQYKLLKMNDPASHIGLKIVFSSADSVNYSHTLNLNNVVIRVSRQSG